MRSTKRARYEYVGPVGLRAHVNGTARFRVETAESVVEWARTQPKGGALVATFIVDAKGKLWLADRRSEHISCARGGRVRAAGEIEFQVAKNKVEVVGATNQSTGFCPRVESWEALKVALDAVGVAHLSYWTAAFEFRRCEQCGELNVVKDEWFVCSNCDEDLPDVWNIGNEQRA
ncbi:hypothetical protein EON83_18925 [bacterium]|nr:MAG: hypothetical protein EON83_18925 [bacterium]